MNYHKTTQLLVGVAVLIAILLIYHGMRLSSQSPWSAVQWLSFGALALGLIGVAFLPGILRRSRGRPPERVSAADLRFSLMLSAVLCPLAFFAVLMFGAFGSLVICLVPLAFAFRSRYQGPPAPNDGNA